MPETTARAGHTPAPWRADRRAVYADHPVRGVVQVAEVFSGACELLAEADANQRLIAAAPDLLAAIESLRDRIEAGGELGMEMVHRAIAKARGTP